ncbi:MAG: hypothetical protein UV01_C0010G0047 [Parcubacteria group bacterium GW2011_GWA2_42_14]|nr:MAG: hypothetical protein UV01_C0010G0047 [Parcubacteria group bacterium GW2011_GWA2_42_14]
MRGRISIHARPAYDGGVAIKFDGRTVASGMNVVEAFITLGGLLKKRGPSVVEMEMAHVSTSLSDRFRSGYRARGTAPRRKRNKR